MFLAPKIMDYNSLINLSETQVTYISSSIICVVTCKPVTEKTENFVKPALCLSYTFYYNLRNLDFRVGTIF